jgi:hypothetical protein
MYAPLSFEYHPAAHNSQTDAPGNKGAGGDSGSGEYPVPLYACAYIRRIEEWFAAPEQVSRVHVHASAHHSFLILILL